MTSPKAEPYTLKELGEMRNLDRNLPTEVSPPRFRATVEALARAEAERDKANERWQTHRCDHSGCTSQLKATEAERDALRQRAEATERELAKAQDEAVDLHNRASARAEAAEKALVEAWAHIEKAKLPPVGWLDCRIPGHGANRDEMLQALRERDEARAQLAKVNEQLSNYGLSAHALGLHRGEHGPRKHCEWCESDVAHAAQLAERFTREEVRSAMSEAYIAGLEGPMATNNMDAILDRVLKARKP